MASVLLHQQARCACRPFRSGTGRRALPSSRIVLQPSRRADVRVNFFKFGGKKSDEAGIYGSQKRDDFDLDDVEHYFNYMGMLAVDGSYDRMQQFINTGMHPVDILLLWACQENDTPKVEELLKAGASLSAKSPEGKLPKQLATKPEILSLIDEAAAAIKA